MTQQEKFLERFKELMKNDGGKKETQDEFAARLGLSRGTVAKYCSGGGMPVSEVLAKICEKCDVSSDYLLGLSDVRKPNADVRAIVEYTGLTEKVVDELHPTAQYQYGSSKLDSKIISAILLSQEWKNVQEELSEFFYHLCQRINLTKEFFEKPQDDIEINAKLDQNEDNIDLHIFKASRSFSLLLDRMADAFMDIPVNKLQGTDVEDFKTYLAEHYRSLYMNARKKIDGQV